MTDLKEWAEERAVFNLNQAERATGIERGSLKVKLSRMVNKGDLERVERGKYSVSDDPMVYASHVENPSYISLWSGLDFYNLTAQEPTEVQVVCARDRKNIEKVNFYFSKNVFGYSKQLYRDYEIFVAGKEKLLVDCLRFGEVPVDELRELVEAMNLDRLVEIVQRTENDSVSKRAGFLTDKILGKKIEELKVGDSNYPRLDLTKGSRAEKDSEWKIKVNNDAF